MARIVVVGEGMIELSPDGSGGWRLGHGGDMLNTAVHLARLGSNVGFLTALGDDPFSRELRENWTREGVDSSLILTDPARRPGLYAITNDPDGERHFTYWRGESAARNLFALPAADAAVTEAARADLLILSMISLAILRPGGREALLDLARQVRARGGRVAFDTNYRPALWEGVAEAQTVHRAATMLTDIGLPTLEDEAALTGIADPAAVADWWYAAGAREVVVKRGGDGCLVDGDLVRPPQRLAALDTSGAGDAFDAGYLHARLAGRPPREAALAGHRLAGWVVMSRGAVPEISAGAPYAELAAVAAARLA